MLMPGSALLSHGEPPALPSAMCHFTSEFGMGSGGTSTLLPPGKLYQDECLRALVSNSLKLN